MAEELLGRISYQYYTIEYLRYPKKVTAGKKFTVIIGLTNVLGATEPPAFAAIREKGKDVYIAKEENITVTAGEIKEAWLELIAPDEPGEYEYTAVVGAMKWDMYEESEHDTRDFKIEVVREEVPPVKIPRGEIVDFDYPAYAIAGQKFTIKVVVRNAGTGKGKLIVDAYFTEVHTKEVVLDVGESTAVGFELTAPSRLGDYPLEVRVSHTDPETNLPVIDDRRQVFIKIEEKPPVGKPRAVIKIRKAPEVVREGEEFKIVVDVSNSGDVKGKLWLETAGTYYDLGIVDVGGYKTRIFTYVATPDVISPGRYINIKYTAGHYEDAKRVKDDEAYVSIPVLPPVPPGKGTIRGKVIDRGTRLPLAGAVVTATGVKSYTAKTNAEGIYSMSVEAGTYLVEATYPEYEPQSERVEVSAGEEEIVDFALAKRVPPPEVAVIHGYVIDAETRAPIPGAEVTCAGKSYYTKADGYYRFEVTPGVYNVVCKATGYEDMIKTVEVRRGEEVRLNFEMKRPAAPPPPARKAIIHGYIVDAATKAPIPSAEVIADKHRALTDEKGYYRLIVDPGTYTITARAPGYSEAYKTVTVEAGEAELVTIELRKVAAPPPPAPAPPAIRPEWIIAGAVAVASIAIAGVVAYHYIRGGR